MTVVERLEFSSCAQVPSKPGYKFYPRHNFYDGSRWKYVNVKPIGHGELVNRTTQNTKKSEWKKNCPVADPHQCCGAEPPDELRS